MKSLTLNQTYDISFKGRTHTNCTLVKIEDSSYIFDVASCYGLLMTPAEVSEAVISPSEDMFDRLMG